MSQFITSEELKAYPLPVTSSQWQKVGDDQLDVVLTYASDHLEDYMDRKIHIATYVDRFHKGSGSESQMLSMYPVTQLTSVYTIDGKNNRSAVGTADFYVDWAAGIIEFLNKDVHRFSKYARYEVTYKAGYASVPGPLKHATALQAVKMLQPLFRGGANFTEVELITELDDQIVELLEPYKRRRIS